jgi:hypothetical protein
MSRKKTPLDKFFDVIDGLNKVEISDHKILKAVRNLTGQAWIKLDEEDLKQLHPNDLNACTDRLKKRLKELKREKQTRIH